jgi:transcriptional accessory protein Tex/SPT6
MEKGKDESRPRISLSRRALERDPWKDVAERFSEGTEMTGRIMRTESFGAFVEIAPGVEGLVHISEMGSGRRLNHAKEAVQLGQDVKVRVLSVDGAKRRISLSMGSGAEGGGGGGRERSSAPRGGGGGGDRGDHRGGGGGRGRDRDRDRGRDEDYEAYAAKNANTAGSGFGSMADFFKNLKQK